MSPLDSQIQVINCQSGDTFPAAPADGVLLTSLSSGWRGIAVELHRLSAYEMPEHYVEGHRLAVNIGAPLQYEWKEQGCWHRTLLRPGDFCLQPHGEVNLPRWQEDFNLLAIALDPQFIDRAFAETNLPEQITFQTRRGATDSAVADFTRYFQQQLKSPSYGGALYGESLALAFSQHLIEQHGTHNPLLRPPPGKLSSRDLKQTIEYIHAHLGDDLSLDSLSAQVHLSAYHFSRLFKQSLGISPHQYVLQNRIERSQRLLLQEHSTNLTDIGLAVGFYDQAHFTRAFKRFVGTTPRRFLKAACS